jgi:hypothetical protein
MRAFSAPRLGPAALIFSLASVLSAGCASQTQKPEGELVLTTEQPGVVTKEYKYITRLGSHIPVRVPKDGVSKPAAGASPVEYVSPEVLRDIQLRPGSR